MFANTRHFDCPPGHVRPVLSPDRWKRPSEPVRRALAHAMHTIRTRKKKRDARTGHRAQNGVERRRMNGDEEGESRLGTPGQRAPLV